MSADDTPIALPAHVAGSGDLNRLVDTARDYARAAAAENTLKAYTKDWAHFARWCRLKGAEPLPPAPEMIGLYLADLASPSGKAPALLVSTIERRPSGLAWNFAQRGFTLDRKNRHIATVLAGIKRRRARPPVQKEAIRSLMDPIDTFTLKVLGASAEFTLIRERTEAGLASARSKGRIGGNPGLRPPDPAALRKVRLARQDSYMERLNESAQDWVPMFATFGLT